MGIDSRALKLIVEPERISTGESNLDLHAKDESFHKGRRPDVVIWPRSPEEISEILRFANDKKIPVTPWGGGTSLEGNPIPVRGGIVLDMRLMNRIIEICPEDLQVRVQAGIEYQKLNHHLRKHGLFFPPDPGATATIGGMIANNASGMQALKYGPTRDHVLKLEVVLPTGEIIKTGSCAFKSSSGYDLTRLFVGSEGTLGVITEATLRLTGLPVEVVIAIASFESVRAAISTASQIIQSGLSPAALELLDDELIRLINKFKKTVMKEQPTLFVEFHGSTKTSLEEDIQFVRENCLIDCTFFKVETGWEKREQFSEIRYSAYDAIKCNNIKSAIIIVDVAVPISKLSNLVDRTKEILRKYKLQGLIFGHVGDGNLHVDIVANPEDESEWNLAQKANEEIVEHGIELGGTATGEHGVGIGKRKFMGKEHGESLEVMRKIKDVLDPNSIMNPGKIFR